MTGNDSPDHLGSHRGLLTFPDFPPASSRVDALIVPTIRPAAQLDHAMALAVELECLLMVLCSGPTRAAEVRAVAPAGLHLLAIDVTPGALRWPPLGAAAVLPERLRVHSDTAAKRNFGMSVAKLLGLARIVFLDDDILVGDAGDLRRTTAYLDRYSEVGLLVAESSDPRSWTPDNSVVCHAYRETGGRQSTFISAGALGVSLEREVSHFPLVYNDDWLFLMGDDGLREPAACGSVRQHAYDPFENPERARAEEFGEVIAEGLMWLQEEDKKLDEATERFWEAFLGHRRGFVDHVLSRVGGLPPGRRERVRAAVAAASDQLAGIDARLCAAYLDAWRADREEWRRHFDALPPGSGADRVLDELTFEHLRPGN